MSKETSLHILNCNFSKFVPQCNNQYLKFACLKYTKKTSENTFFGNPDFRSLVLTKLPEPRLGPITYYILLISTTYLITISISSGKKIFFGNTYMILKLEIMKLIFN